MKKQNRIKKSKSINSRRINADGEKIYFNKSSKIFDEQLKNGDAVILPKSAVVEFQVKVDKGMKELVREKQARNRTALSLEHRAL